MLGLERFSSSLNYIPVNDGNTDMYRTISFKGRLAYDSNNLINEITALCKGCLASRRSEIHINIKIANSEVPKVQVNDASIQ